MFPCSICSMAFINLYTQCNKLKIKLRLKTHNTTENVLLAVVIHKLLHILISLCGPEKEY